MEGNTSFERKEVVNYGHAYEGKIIFLFLSVSAACATTIVCHYEKQYKEKKIRHKNEKKVTLADGWTYLN